MLTPGNLKLGGRRIWGFALPSADPAVCPGMSDTCRVHCYAAAVERYRLSAAAAYRRNLALSRSPSFVTRVRAFLVAHAVRTVRVQVGGDFYARAYARKWLRIMRRSPRVRFFFYTRAWRTAAIKPAIDRMAALRNCVAWYSCDRDTGVPGDVPAGVRVAWLSVAADDIPPAGVDLVFRVRRLRRAPAPPGGPPVCSAEDGVVRRRRVTCEGCGRCWQEAPAPGRIDLPVVSRPGGSGPSLDTPS
jgi:hypothetical protein